MPEAQVDAVPVRRKNDRLEILLVTSRRKGRWIIPKGGRSRGLDDKRAASREAREEGGVRGEICGGALGTYKHRSRKPKRVTVYRLDVEREDKRWPEQAFRRRTWVSPRKARKLIEDPGLRKLIRKVQWHAEEEASRPR